MSSSKSTAKPKTVKKVEKSVDSHSIRELAELLNDTGLTEIEYETDMHRIRVAKSLTSGAVAPVAPAPVATPVPASAPTVEPVAPSPAGDPIKSPLVGTAYMSAQPGAPAFVKEGDIVTEGQTLMIVEAMKVMNPIKALRAGKIVAIHAQDAAPVEFDEVLMEIN